MATLPEIVVRPCVVCGDDVAVTSDATDDVLCIVHWFTADPTEEWESE